MTSLPTHAQVLQLPETIRQTVPAEFIDENDHMNIGRYLEVAATAAWTHHSSRGLGQTYIEERGLSTFTAEHHLRYVGELRLGDELSAHVRPIGRSPKALHTMVFLLDRTHERLAFTYEDVVVHVDMQSRRVVPFPDDIAESLDGAIAEMAELGWAAPLSGSMGLRG